MMFDKRFRPGIVEGRITRTYRYWKRPQVKPDGLYKLGTDGFIRVTGVKTVAPRGIRSTDAAAAGFGERGELLDFLAAYRGDGRTLYRVDFEYVGRLEGRDPDRSAVASNDEVGRLEKALALRDRNSKWGPWTHQTLRLVAEHPGLSSAKMAQKLGRDQAALKRDMRKLKQLGLTISLETGYELSSKGASYLEARGL